jgi:hypothetical protein
VRAKKLRKGTKTKTPFQQSPDWIDSEREAILDYLHGGIPDREVAAAAYYEEARESKSFRYAAAQYKKGAEDKIFASSEIEFLPVAIPELRDRPDDFDFLIMQWPWRAIWTCRQFPDVPWTEVRTPEKQRIQSHFPSRYDCSGFNTLDADLLDAMSVIEKLKNLAQEAREKWHAVRAAQGTKSLSEIRNKNVLTDVIVGVRDDQTPWIEHIVCTLNYRSGKEALVKAFGAWLGANRAEILGKHYKPPIVKGSEHSRIRFKEILKSLTAARLYATLGFKEAKEWTKQNRRRKNHTLVAFFEQKLRKTPTGKHYTGPLFKEQRQWKAAIAKAESELRRIDCGYGLT